MSDKHKLSFTLSQFGDLFSRIENERETFLRKKGVSVHKYESVFQRFGVVTDGKLRKDDPKGEKIIANSIKGVMELKLDATHHLAKRRKFAINARVLYDAFREFERAKKLRQDILIWIEEEYAEAFLAFAGCSFDDLKTDTIVFENVVLEGNAALHSRPKIKNTDQFRRLLHWAIPIVVLISIAAFFVFYETQSISPVNGVITEPRSNSTVGSSIVCKGNITGSFEAYFFWLVIEVVDEEGHFLYWPKDQITTIDDKGNWEKQVFDEPPKELEHQNISISLWAIDEENHRMIKKWMSDGLLTNPRPSFPPLKDIPLGKRLFRVDKLVKQR